MRLYNRNIALLVLLAVIGLSCQLATEPTAVAVQSTLIVHVHDRAGNALPTARVFLVRDSTASGVAPVAVEGATATSRYTLTVPVIGESYSLIVAAPPPTQTTAYSPGLDTVHFRMPCHDTAILVMLDRKDSLLCGSLDVERDLDFGTFCVDQDTTLSLMTSDFVHGCPGGATISAISIPANLPGLTIEPVFRGNAETPATIGSPWASGQALAVRLRYSTQNATPVVLDGKDVVIDASPSIKITLHLKGRGIRCDSCNCPAYDSISFGLARPSPAASIRDTNGIAIGDAVRSTAVSLRAITNTGDCDLLVSRIKDFSNPQIRVVSFNGVTGATSAVVSPRASLGSLMVEFSAIVRGEFADTALYQIQLRTKDGLVSNCDTVPVYYHGHVGQGICQIDTGATNAHLNSYLKNTSITNCVGADEEYRSICIRNIGDAALHTTLSFQKSDPQFSIRYDDNGSVYTGEDITIAAGASKCFSIHFVPATNPPPAQYSNALVACALVLPVTGNVRTQCINCLDGAMRQFGVTATSYEGFVTDSNRFTFISDKNGNQDVFAKTVTASTVTFTSVSGATTFTLLRSAYTLSQPLITLCDDNVAIGIGKAGCGSGSGTSITAGLHDLILFEPPVGKCGLIYIDNIHNSNGLEVVDFQATYPVN